MYENLPSLLIYTFGSALSNLATRGTASRISARVGALTALDGKVLNMHASSELRIEKLFYFKVSSFNGKWSDAEIAPFFSNHINKVPSAPLNVLANIISDAQVGVSWCASSFSGGSSISKCFMQWDTEESLNQKPVIILNTPQQEYYFCIISDLNPSKFCLVHVSAYNPRGHSEARRVIPSNNNTEIHENIFC